MSTDLVKLLRYLEVERIDKSANMPWEDLKARMRGAMKEE